MPNVSVYVSLKNVRKRNTPSEPIEPTVCQAVVHARVSSKEQENGGYSIPARLKLLMDYAAHEGFAVSAPVSALGNRDYDFNGSKENVNP